MNDEVMIIIMVMTFTFR